MKKIHIDSLGLVTANEETELIAHIKNGGHIAAYDTKRKSFCCGLLTVKISPKETVFLLDGGSRLLDGHDLFLCNSKDEALNKMYDLQKSLD